MARISKEERERVRLRLLVSAAGAFAEHGFEGARIDEISTAAGYAKGTVYGYFDSKAELLAAVLTLGVEEAIDHYRRGAAEGSVAERLRALAAADVALVKANEPVMKVIARELLAGRPETAKALDAAVGPFYDEVRAIIDDGIKSGELRSDLDPRLLVQTFAGLLQALYVDHWRTGRPSWKALPDLLVTVFVEGARRAP